MTIRNNGHKVVLGNRKIPVPIEVLEIHEQLRVHGDYQRIADMVSDPLVGVTKVSRTIKTKLGEPHVVKAIVEFYNEVKKANDIYESSSE